MHGDQSECADAGTCAYLRRDVVTPLRRSHGDCHLSVTETVVSEHRTYKCLRTAEKC